jgi:hypothetical protein
MISEKLAHLEVTLDAAAVMPVRDLQRQIDRVVFLQSLCIAFLLPRSLSR